MKSLQLYVCEHCGTKYKDKNECKKCEDSHKVALEIHDMRFHACKDSDNYPDKVVILSILVDTFSSRILNPMLLPSGKRNIVVF